MDLSPKIRYTDTSYIIAQQWEKGGEKNTFTNVYAYEYNRQKFANLAKCDEKQSIAALANLPLSTKFSKRVVPVVPPVPPSVQQNDDNNNNDEIKRETLVANAESSSATAETATATNRKQRKRKTKSLERIRDQSNEIELSDSDEEIINKVAGPIPIITTTDCITIAAAVAAADEPDASVASITITDTIAVHTNNNTTETTSGDEPAIRIDAYVTCNDETVSDRSQISYDEILKIDESLNEDLNDLNESILVEIHNEPIIELRIHEEGDSDKEISASIQGGLVKEFHIETDQERCHSEDDTIGREESQLEKPERFVQSDTEVLEKTPIELVLECDINENVVHRSDATKMNFCKVIDFDYNHNDVVKSNEINGCATDEIKTTSPSQSNGNSDDGKDNETNETVENRETMPIEQPNELHRVSISSRSSFGESDGFDSEPMYATVDAALQMKNYDAKSLITKSQTFPVKSSQHYEKTAADHLGLNYVTERILASVLPKRTTSFRSDEQTIQPALKKHHDNEFSKNGRPHNSNASLDDLPQDIYEQELISMLEQKHGKNYKLFDLESCISTITLEKLCELCKHMDAWLGSGRDRVVILQDRGDRQRLGSAIAAYLEYLNICASSYAHRNGLSNEDVRAQNAIARNWLDLDIFSMKKFLEDVIGPLRVPSHRRYLHYFSGLLSGKIRINSAPIYLRFVTIESPPSWNQNEPISLQQSEWRSFIKIYEGLNCVFTSDIHVIPITTRQFIYEIGQLRLRGDVIIRCYQLTMNERSIAQTSSPQQITRELIFSTQFHTCAITNRDITFFRSDLDYACDDPRIPTDHKVTLHFSDNNQTNDNRGLYFQSPLVKIEPLNAVAKYNSLETFDDGSLHTQGPLDGSLYATILKSPKSPLKSPTFPPAFISNIVNNNYHQQQQQQSKTELAALVSSTPKPYLSSQNLISPPPEFSNKKIVEIKECYTTISPIDAASTKSQSNSSTLNRENREQSKSQTRSHTSTPSYEEIQVPTRSSSREATLRLHNQHYQTAPRPGSSLSINQQQQQQQSELPQRSSSASRSVTYATNLNQYLQPSDNFNYTNSTIQTNGTVVHRSQSYQDGRESVNSPLTLSMDSGISSSGIANRRLQGSSVSPSSYPSQSPQERHQELDDILSDMLLTVQDIPDIGKQQQQQQQQQQFVRKTTQNSTTISSANHNRPQLHLQIPKQQPLYGSTNTVKRSQSCTSQDESNCSTISRSTVHTTGHIRERNGCGDFYDTASTTTITPTPSDCGGGRETPFQHQHLYGRTQNECKRDSQHHQQILTKQAIEQRERELIMDLQNQSFDYPQSLRTISSASDAIVNDHKLNSNQNQQQQQQKLIASSVTSEEDEQIPYHAREDSRPFTYGDPTGVQLSPNSSSNSNLGKGTGMIKLQAGLSSPSLVRKHLGGNQNGTTTTTTTAAHKNPNIGRNDFEEMLLQRREKILNEKYSIGDKTPNGNSVSNNTNTNNNQNNHNNNHSASANVNNNKWNTNTNNGSNTLNGYQYHEPLKRSNTMDGGFGRGTGYTSDGSSGQTWLQLQQQKLRAKKEQQHKGDHDYYEQRTIHTETRNRPQRSRSSQSSHRYDGYSSDTGAFDSRAFIDEVDYRRPLHVQTPTRPNEHSAGYHTITTKTTTVSNERPFVSVKRAHEQSKANINNNIVGVREESFSSYRSETEADTSLAGSPRPETPAFPLTPRTPYGFNGSNQTLPPKSPTSIRKDFYAGSQQVINQNDATSCYTSRRNSTTSTANSEPRDIAPHLVKFVRDSSKFWYKPSISREEAIALLRNAQPGSFIVRNSTTFNNAFGLVLKVSHPPPNAQKGSGSDELVRHFLIEPTARGVRLKGCSNEPVFTSLSALVYEHSIHQLSLPHVLIIPERDLQNVDYHSPAQHQLMSQGAACNVLYLFTFETESLTGPEAIRKAVSVLYSRKPLPKPTEVHFKVSQHGVTLTDNTRQLFFRKHYPANNISYIGLDPDDRRWSIRVTGEVPVSNKTIFAFVARRSASSNDNQCHVFCELEANQPAAAIAAFANKVIPSYGAQPYLRDI